MFMKGGAYCIGLVYLSLNIHIYIFCRYARKYFPPANVDGTMTKEIQRAMALLAFKPETSCPPYRVRIHSLCYLMLIMGLKSGFLSF